MTCTKRLILVDDDPDGIALFRFALEEICPEIELVVEYDGCSFLKLLANEPSFDYIVMDIHLPIISGKECLKSIRLKNEFDFVPIIILSGDENLKLIKYCLQNGATKYYQKPISFSKYKKMIADILATKLFVLSEETSITDKLEPVISLL